MYTKFKLVNGCDYLHRYDGRAAHSIMKITRYTFKHTCYNSTAMVNWTPEMGFMNSTVNNLVTAQLYHEKSIIFICTTSIIALFPFFNDIALLMYNA